MVDCCGNCKWYRDQACHRRSPRAKGKNAWPEVTADQWCGDWRPTCTMTAVEEWRWLEELRSKRYNIQHVSDPKPPKPRERPDV